MPVMLVTLAVSKFFTGLLNDSAPSNIELISQTLKVFHEVMSRLKLGAPANMPDISVTFDVLKPLRSLLI
jgi:hypothetical protein